MAQSKEIYFFNVHFEKGLAWYETNFSDWTGQTAIGEATPGYISHPDAPARIRASLGNVKLIASLRHPVDRAYSAFWHHLRQGQIPPKTDFYTFFRQSDLFEIRSRGYYFPQMHRYLQHFPRENILVLIYEQIIKDGQQANADCLKFLGVDSRFEPSVLEAKVNSGGQHISLLNGQAWMLRLSLRRAVRRATNKKLLPRGIQKPLLRAGRQAFEQLAFKRGPKVKHFERLDSDLRQNLLNEYYLSDIQQLEDLLGRGFSAWYSQPQL
jgi:Sulfotransferase domain